MKLAHTGHINGPATTGRVIRWATFYDPLVNLLTLGRAKALRQATVDLAGIKSGESVLDVGCGTGDLTLIAAKQVGAAGRVVGIDAAPEMIAVAQRKSARTNLPVTFQIDVIERLPFADDSFDVVLSSLMFHHLPDDLKRQGLAEIRRVLKPGGRLLIVDMKRGTDAHAHLSLPVLLHGNLRRGLQDYAQMARDAGFTALETGDMKFSGVGFLRAQAG